MKKNKRFILLSALVLAMFFSMVSCSVAVKADEVITIDLDFDDFRNWESLATVSDNRTEHLVNQDEPSLSTNRNLRESKVYKTINNSENVEGNAIVAFRLTLVPKQGLNLSFVSFQNETNFTEDDAPSSYNAKKLGIVHTWHWPTLATLLKKYWSLLTVCRQTNLCFLKPSLSSFHTMDKYIMSNLIN